MKLIDLWKGKLKAAKIQRQIALRQMAAAQRALDRINVTIFDLESKLEKHQYMAKPAPKTEQHD